MSSSYPPYYAYPSAPPLKRVTPKPPGLHWGWVLALSIVTGGIFSSVWLLVQANWIRKMRQGKSIGFWLALANLLWLPLMFFLGIAVGIAGTTMPGGAAGLGAMLSTAARTGAVVLYLAAVYVMRSEMEEGPIGIPLSGAVTLFFGVFYFQYHLRDYGEAYEPEIGLGLAARATGPVAADAVVPYPTAAEVGVAYPPTRSPPIERE